VQRKLPHRHRRPTLSDAEIAEAGCTVQSRVAQRAALGRSTRQGQWTVTVRVREQDSPGSSPSSVRRVASLWSRFASGFLICKQGEKRVSVWPGPMPAERSKRSRALLGGAKCPHCLHPRCVLSAPCIMLRSGASPAAELKSYNQTGTHLLLGLDQQHVIVRREQPDDHAIEVAVQHREKHHHNLRGAQ